MKDTDELRSAARRVLEKEILARFPPGVAREAWLRWLDEVWKDGASIPPPVFRSRADELGNDDLLLM